MAGVPDIYQGCELSGLSLVDPDNRRPVDFARRRALLADLDGGRLEAGAAPGDGGHRLDAAKLLVTAARAAAAPGSPGVVRRRATLR